jgi:hypothetical protein
MIYRNLLCSVEIDESKIINEELLNKLQQKLKSKQEGLLVNTIYVLSSIASVNP